jgi:hypothetical protein
MPDPSYISQRWEHPRVFHYSTKALEDLLDISSLYVTSRLIQNAKKALKEYDTAHKME